MTRHVAVSLALLFCFAATLARGQVRPQRVRVSEGVMQGLVLKKVSPEYPQDAKKDHIQGAVELQVVVDKKGNVANIKVVGGPERLVPASINAVKQWKYRPYLLNGDPMEVETKVTVNFTLAQ
jgi:protein TonB